MGADGVNAPSNGLWYSYASQQCCGTETNELLSNVHQMI